MMEDKAENTLLFIKTNEQKPHSCFFFGQDSTL